MRVLLTGASSSPGFKTLIELALKGYDVYAVYNQHPIEHGPLNVNYIRLDLTDYPRVSEKFRDVKPDIVIHMAAYGDVEGCEIDRERAWKVNVRATHQLVKLSLKSGVEYFMYLSTDYVFDGERGMYREDDIPYPINFYGLTKLVAEEIVKSTLENSIIIRSSAIYGFGMGRMNFGKFLIEALKRGQRVKALTDQWLSPTLNTLLAKAIVEILEKRIKGILHVAGERVSRYEFAIKVADKFGFRKDLIEPITMKDIRWRARRPRDSSLDCSKARSILSTEFHSLSYALDVFFNEYKGMLR